MDIIFYWTGVVFWTLIGLALLWFLAELLLGLANSISFHHWSYVSAKKHKRKLKWHMLPISILTQAWFLLGHRKDSTTIYTSESGGTWRGIGDWHV